MNDLFIPTLCRIFLFKIFVIIITDDNDERIITAKSVNMCKQNFDGFEYFKL